MSKLGCEMEEEFEVFITPTEAVLGALDADPRGLAETRGLSLT